MYTTQQVAERLGISARRVRSLTQSRHVGHKFGRDWLYSEQDVDAMRVRVPGRRRMNPESSTRNGDV